MNEIYFGKIALELNLQPRQVAATARLLTEGATVPFIARYRKEATGLLDEVAITGIRDRLVSLVELDQRREAIVKSLEERGLMTDVLKLAITRAETMAALEDIYQPYRPKRRTRAMIAKEKGLEPLATLLLAQDPAMDPTVVAAAYVDAGKGVESVEAALAGARDILAEQISDDARARQTMRTLYLEKAVIRSKVLSDKQDQGAKFKDYFDWTEPFSKVPSHRLLAMRRGEEEGFLMMRIQPPEEEALAILEPQFVKAVRTPVGEQVRVPCGRWRPSARSPYRRST